MHSHLKLQCYFFIAVTMIEYLVREHAVFNRKFCTNASLIYSGVSQHATCFHTPSLNPAAISIYPGLLYIVICSID